MSHLSASVRPLNPQRRSARSARYELELSLLPKFVREGQSLLADGSNRDQCLSDVRQLTQEWERKYNGMAELAERAYAFVTEADPYKKQEFVYIHYDASRTPVGYMVCRKEVTEQGQRLVCSRFVFRGMDGLVGLLALAKSFQADHKSIVFTLPSSILLNPLIDEWSLGAFSRSDASLGMARIVNAEAALRAASCRGAGEISVRVQDGQIAENNGVFTVRFADNAAVSVEKDSGKEAQIVMEISEFSRFLMEAVDTEALAYSRRASGYSEEKKEELGKIFYRKPCFLTEYF